MLDHMLVLVLIFFGISSSLVAQMVKHLSTMRETWVRSLGQDLAWRIPWMEEPGGLCPQGHKESDTTERLDFLSYIIISNSFKIVLCFL